MTDLTLRGRRSLLAVCAIALIIATTGLVPTRITALGIEFSAADQQTMLTILALGIAYFFLAFVVYSAGDYMTRETLCVFSASGERAKGSLSSNPCKSFSRLWTTKADSNC